MTFWWWWLWWGGQYHNGQDWKHWWIIREAGTCSPTFLLQVMEKLKSINGGNGRKNKLSSAGFFKGCGLLTTCGFSQFRGWVLRMKNRSGKKLGQIYLGLFPQLWTDSSKKIEEELWIPSPNRRVMLTNFFVCFSF